MIQVRLAPLYIRYVWVAVGDIRPAVGVTAIEVDDIDGDVVVTTCELDVVHT